MPTSPDDQADRPPARYESGDLINSRYRVEAVLGSGAFSTVYRVYDSIRDQDVALKIFAPNYGIDVAQRELRALVNLRHPNIVEVIDAGQTLTQPSLWYIKSEYVEGDLLTRYTEAGGEFLPYLKALSIFDQLLDAFQVFHPDAERIEELQALAELDSAQFEELRKLQGQGLIHRDIKPQNVMLTREGNVKLFDFNIAAPAGSPVMTVSGTPSYQPPEANLATWDVSWDLFAAGVLLYELLTHEHPYPDRIPSPDCVIRDPREVNTEISRAVSEVVLGTCAPSMEARFKSAKAIRLALQDAVRRSLDSTPMFETGAFLVSLKAWMRMSLPPIEIEPVGVDKWQAINTPDGYRVVLSLTNTGANVDLETASNVSLKALRESESSIQVNADPERTPTGMKWAFEIRTTNVEDAVKMVGLAITEAFAGAVDIAGSLIGNSDAAPVEDLPVGHRQLGWITSADVRLPFVVARSAAVSGPRWVLSAKTMSGSRRYEAMNGAYLWEPSGHALPWETIVLAKWEIAQVTSPPETRILSDGSIEFKWPGPIEDLDGQGLSVRVENRRGSAFLYLATSEPDAAPVHHSSGARRMTIGQFIESRARPDSARDLMAFVSGAEDLGIEWDFGELASSADGFAGYVALRPKGLGNAHVVAHLWPASKRLILRLDGEWARSRPFATARTGAKSSAFGLQVALTTAAAITEALELLDICITRAGPADAGSKSNRERVLDLIRLEPGLSDSEIVRRTGIRPHQQVNQICRRLAAQGLIKREPAPNGRIQNLPA